MHVASFRFEICFFVRCSVFGVLEVLKFGGWDVGMMGCWNGEEGRIFNTEYRILINDLRF